MIEIIIKKHLEKKLNVDVLLQRPTPDTKSAYVVFEKTGSSKRNHLLSSTFAFQSYANSLYAASCLNENVKEAVESLIELNEIRSVRLNSDYNFTDVETKMFRYQAVFDINYY